MQRAKRDRSTVANQSGLLGWVYAGRYRTERYLYILHRVSGLGILLYLLMHIYVTGFKIKGEEAWEGIMASFGTPLFHFGEYLVFAAVIFHALNGIRLVLTELGYLLGKPKRPIYPYPLALMRQRLVMVILMILAAVIIIYGGFDFFAFH
ncbi:succinate dehydrogenase, cytochrome b556 subunit [candidate division KSB1 bacterium]